MGSFTEHRLQSELSQAAERTTVGSRQQGELQQATEPPGGGPISLPYYLDSLVDTKYKPEFTI